MLECIECKAEAVFTHYDCCEDYQVQPYCAECVFDGGATISCEWEVRDLDGNIIRQG